MKINQGIYLQFLVANQYMRKHRLSPQEFLELDKKSDLLGFLEDGYEPFHLMGIDGIIEEVEQFVKL